MRKFKRLNRSERLRRFLEAGYFPEELPPPFVTHSFGRYRKALSIAWSVQPSFVKFKSRPEQITIPRYGSARRRLTIPNPINYFRLSDEISAGWTEIRDHIKSSQVTEFRPIIDMDGERSIFKLDFDIVGKRTGEILAAYDHAFKTDIARFYHSIYTHSIAWALYGRTWVKTNLHSSAFKQSLGNKLDNELRKGQEDQSIGLPIGPDTSRILSEIVAVGLERELKPLLTDFDRRAVRYVDDILLGFDESESEDQVASALEAAMSHYELDVNVTKTRILGVRGAEEVGWVSELRSCNVSSTKTGIQRDELERFFNLALVYSAKNEKDSVLKWAVKRARSFRILPDNLDFYFDWMIRITRKAPACLPILAQSLIEANSNKRPIPKDRVEKFVKDIIRVHARVGHAFEVSWALFIAKGLRISLDRLDLEYVFRLENSLCALLCMDLDKRGLVAGGLDETAWLPYASEDGLTSPMWLLSYEAARKGWWSSGTRTYASSHPLFGPMLARGISFYDEGRNVSRLRHELKAAQVQRRRAGYILSHWLEYI